MGVGVMMPLLFIFFYREIVFLLTGNLCSVEQWKLHDNIEFYWWSSTFFFFSKKEEVFSKWNYLRERKGTSQKGDQVMWRKVVSEAVLAIFSICYDKIPWKGLLKEKKRVYFDLQLEVSVYNNGKIKQQDREAAGYIIFTIKKGEWGWGESCCSVSFLHLYISVFQLRNGSAHSRQFFYNQDSRPGVVGTRL